MNIELLKKFYFSLSRDEQKLLLDKLNRINLATDINKDEEFIKEVVEELFKDYPVIKEYAEF
jgi:hypothetical protein